MTIKAKIIRNRYRAGALTSAQVWAYADDGTITAQEATLICGPRPE